jgi:hypothetical protein
VTIAFTIYLKHQRQKTREEETEGKEAKVEGGISVSQKRVPSLIFAQNASTPTEHVSFL